MTNRDRRAVRIEPAGGGYRVLVDGAPLASPARRELRLASAELARAVAAEWTGRTGRAGPAQPRLTVLAGRAADLDARERERIEADLAAHIETDLLCYRAEAPPDLVALQAARWDPLLAWAGRRFGCAPAVTAGVLPTAPAPALVARYTAVLAGLGAAALVGLQAAARATGSLVVALALLEGEIDAEAAWRAANVEEGYNAARWGDDDEAAGHRALRRADLAAAAVHLAALRPPRR